MRNSLVLLAVLLSVAAFAGMMRIKTDVQTMDRKRLQLVRERADLRETKRVLEAEWALLASPSRMERVVQTMGYVPATALDVIAPMDVISGTTPVVRGVSGSAVAAVLAAGFVSNSEVEGTGPAMVAEGVSATTTVPVEEALPSEPVNDVSETSKPFGVDQ
jgi:hypothetical protein